MRPPHIIGATWDSMLPDMQMEIRLQADPLTRAHLAMSCRAEALWREDWFHHHWSGSRWHTYEEKLLCHGTEESISWYQRDRPWQNSLESRIAILCDANRPGFALRLYGCYWSAAPLQRHGSYPGRSVPTTTKELMAFTEVYRGNNPLKQALKTGDIQTLSSGEYSRDMCEVGLLLTRDSAPVWRAVWNYLVSKGSGPDAFFGAIRTRDDACWMATHFPETIHDSEAWSEQWRRRLLEGDLSLRKWILEEQKLTQTLSIRGLSPQTLDARESIEYFQWKWDVAFMHDAIFMGDIMLVKWCFQHIHLANDTERYFHIGSSGIPMMLCRTMHNSCAGLTRRDIYSRIY